MKTKIECINCHKKRACFRFSMSVLVDDAESSEDGCWEEVERVPVCPQCIGNNPTTSMTIIGYLVEGAT